MNYNFFDSDQTDTSRQMTGISYIRLFHAAPGAPAVDVYLNDKLVARRLPYGQFTDYIPVAMGTYNVEVYRAGMKDTPILRTNIPIADRKVYTLAIIGTLPRIAILPIEDEYEPLSPNMLNIRFSNLSPNAPGLDLVTRAGAIIFSNVHYTEVSDYRMMRPGQYEFFIRPAGTPINALYLPVNLLPRRNLTFYLIGLYGLQPSQLQVLIPMDGTTYLRV